MKVVLLIEVYNTTYYYKLKLENREKFSNVLEVSTLESTKHLSTNSASDTLGKNPKTGMFISVIGLLIVFILSIITKEFRLLIDFRRVDMFFFSFFLIMM